MTKKTGRSKAELLLPPWEELLSAASRLQQIIPHMTMVGGSAAALHARHRHIDADHTKPNLKEQFDEILETLESITGWKTARTIRPVLILGSLDGIQTGIRQLKRHAPLETQTISVPGRQDQKLTIPTLNEILRIKAFLAITRNTTRDYLDIAALSSKLTPEQAAKAFDRFDELYPQDSGESATQQVIAQLTNPQPIDKDEVELSTYKNLAPHWHDWKNIETALSELAIGLMSRQRDLVHRAELSTLETYIKEASHIGPSQTQDKILISWRHHPENERNLRYKLIARHADTAKHLALTEWNRRDPIGFLRWNESGRPALTPQQPPQSDKSNGRDP